MSFLVSGQSQNICWLFPLLCVLLLWVCVCVCCFYVCACVSASEWVRKRVSWTQPTQTTQHFSTHLPPLRDSCICVDVSVCVSVYVSVWVYVCVGGMDSWSPPNCSVDCTLFLHTQWQKNRVSDSAQFAHLLVSPIITLGKRGSFSVHKLNWTEV